MTQFNIAILEGLWFKLQCRNFDFIKLLAQILKKKFKILAKQKKDICWNGKDIMVLNYEKGTLYAQMM